MIISPMQLINLASPRWYAAPPVPLRSCSKPAVQMAIPKYFRFVTRPPLPGTRGRAAHGRCAAFDGIDHLHLTGIVLGVSPVVRAAALTPFEAAIAAGVSVSFDPNLRLNLWRDKDEMRAVINTVAARATVVMPGLGEGRLLTGYDNAEAIAGKYRLGAREVVVKLGGEGARAWTADGQTARSRRFAVTPIDTVGAGDGFAAGYLAASCRRQPARTS